LAIRYAVGWTGSPERGAAQQKGGRQNVAASPELSCTGPQPVCESGFEAELEARATIAAPRWKILAGDALTELDQVGDGTCKLVVTSPPYNIGKEYERDKRLTLDEYFEWIKPILEKIARKVSEDGHLCWQTGNFIEDGELFPLDLHFYSLIKKLGFRLKNRIVWHFNFGLNATSRFSGRYETLLWFTKSDHYTFNLDPVRVRQLYPGKRHSAKKGDRAGQPSGNPKGKNPSDVWAFDAAKAFDLCPIWEVPNVKANHPEKTSHPCQFPSELVERCVLAFTQENDLVLDPFVGSGTTAIAALQHNRRAIGIDRDRRYADLARHRLELLVQGELRTRPLGKPVRRPVLGEAVATMPEEWRNGRVGGEGGEDEKGNS
jgi:adenine-specific DNA-methyltransferase